MSPHRAEMYCQMLKFLADCIDPERYGHAVSDEVRQHASRILKLSPVELPHIPKVSEFAEPVHLADE